MCKEARKNYWWFHHLEAKWHFIIVWLWISLITLEGPPRLMFVCFLCSLKFVFMFFVYLPNCVLWVFIIFYSFVIAVKFVGTFAVVLILLLLIIRGLQLLSNCWFFNIWSLYEYSFSFYFPCILSSQFNCFIYLKFILRCVWRGHSHSFTQ